MGRGARMAWPGLLGPAMPGALSGGHLLLKRLFSGRWGRLFIVSLRKGPWTREAGDLDRPREGGRESRPGKGCQSSPRRAGSGARADLPWRGAAARPCPTRTAPHGAEEDQAADTSGMGLGSLEELSSSRMSRGCR